MQATWKTIWRAINRLVHRQTLTGDSKASAPEKQAVVQQAQQSKGVLAAGIPQLVQSFLKGS